MPLNKLRKDRHREPFAQARQALDGGGLFLQVAAKGQASWVYQFCLRGKARWMSIGPLSVLNIDKARKLHQELRAQVWSGVDPIEARGGRWGSHKIGSPEQRRETASNYPTFKQAAEAYLKAKGPRVVDGVTHGEWSNDQDRDHRARLAKFVYPAIGNIPCDQLTRSDFVKLLTPIWDGINGNNKGVKVRSLCERILNSIEGIEQPCVASWTVLESQLLATSKRPVKQHAYLRPPDSRVVYQKLAADDRQQAKMVRMIMLTAVRLEEVLMMRWQDIDYKTGVWTVPAEFTKKTKAGQFPNFVPITSEMRAILGEHHGTGDVWRNGARSPQSLLNLIEGYGLKGVMTNHGNRSTLSDFITENLGRGLGKGEDRLIDVCLSHRKKGVDTHYGVNSPYFKQRREVLQALADYYTGRRSDPARLKIVNKKAAAR
jgi:integrase